MNTFNKCEKRLTTHDLRQVEQKLSIQLPEEVKQHYLRFNGGTPANSIWTDPAGTSAPIEVSSFFPIRYRKSHGDDPDFTMEGIAREEWADQRLPRTCLPFAIDCIGNYICVNRVSWSVCYVDRDAWSDERSPEENWAANTRDLARSFDVFVDGLKPEEKTVEPPRPMPPAPAGPKIDNTFAQSGPALTERDFLLVEQDMRIKLPGELKRHYQAFNGGIPAKSVWFDASGEWDYLEVAQFLPLLSPPGKDDNPALSVAACMRQAWDGGSLLPSLIPFATDWGGNYFCINHTNGKVCYVVRDVWSDNLTAQKNMEVNTRYLAASLPQFVDGLQPAEDD